MQHIEFDLFGEPKLKKNDSIEATHSGGRGEPMHDWFPYLEGFSSAFVKNILDLFFDGPAHILEPFSGVGTTPVTLSQMGISCSYCEINPALRELIELKSAVINLNTKDRTDLAGRVIDLVNNLDSVLLYSKPCAKLLETNINVFGSAIYFEENQLNTICKMKTMEEGIDDRILKKVFRAGVMTCLLKGSLLRRAGDVRYKTKRELALGIPDIVELVKSKLTLIANDISRIQSSKAYGLLSLLDADAKKIRHNNEMLFDGVITSPPYLNGTNYIRNTKLELWYTGYLKSKDDLRSYRSKVVTSAINDVSKDTGKHIVDEARDIIAAITEECYDARIPKMVTAYFDDMSYVFEGFYKTVKTGGAICIDIGDSVYGGIHVPTHEILKATGQRIGLKFESEVLLRKRHSNKGAPLTQRLLIFRR